MTLRQWDWLGGGGDGGDCDFDGRSWLALEGSSVLASCFDMFVICRYAGCKRATFTGVCSVSFLFKL